MWIMNRLIDVKGCGWMDLQGRRWMNGCGSSMVKRMLKDGD